MSTANKLKLGFALALAALVTALILANLQAIEVDLLVAKIETRLAFLIFATLAVGGLLGWLLRSFGPGRPKKGS